MPTVNILNNRLLDKYFYQKNYYKTLLMGSQVRLGRKVQVLVLHLCTTRDNSSGLSIAPQSSVVFCW